MSGERLKYMEFVENIINRMNANSFTIKGWAIAVVAALFALAAKDTNYRFALVAYFALLIFWVLDAYYLSQEKMYRALFEAIVGQPETAPVTFNMNAKTYNTGKNKWWVVFLSKTILPFYILLIVISGAVIYLILKPTC